LRRWKTGPKSLAYTVTATGERRPTRRPYTYNDL